MPNPPVPGNTQGGVAVQEVEEDSGKRERIRAGQVDDLRDEVFFTASEKALDHSPSHPGRRAILRKKPAQVIRAVHLMDREPVRAQNLLRQESPAEAVALPENYSLPPFNALCKCSTPWILAPRAAAASFRGRRPREHFPPDPG